MPQVPPVLLILYGVPLAYPVLKVWTGGILHKGGGLAGAAAGLLLGLGLGANLTSSFPLFYRLEAGYRLYLLSMLGLVAGVLLYRRAPAATAT